jgi:hypothetical protein
MDIEAPSCLSEVYFPGPARAGERLREFLIACRVWQGEGGPAWSFCRALARAAACAALDPTHRIARALAPVEFQVTGRLSVLRRELGSIMVIQSLTANFDRLIRPLRAQTALTLS